MADHDHCPYEEWWTDDAALPDMLIGGAKRVPTIALRTAPSAVLGLSQVNAPSNFDPPAAEVRVGVLTRCHESFVTKDRQSPKV